MECNTKCENKCNIGGVDRFLRISIGLVAIGAGLYFHNWWGALGVIPLMTGFFRYCPAYGLVGMSTSCKNKTNDCGDSK
jgi:hypothetical protein